MKIIVLFNLRPDISVARYEEWARTTDIPVVNDLGSIEKFSVFKTTGVLGSDDKPPYDYVEIADVADMELFGKETSTEAMKKIAAEFQALADNPTFITTTAL